jgi:hypothetical protein
MSTPEERKPYDFSDLTAENFRLDIQDYLPTMATSRQKLVAEASEKGKNFAKADYPFAIASGQVLFRIAEKLAKDWYTNMVEITKDYIKDGKVNKELYEYWLVKWADFNEEILRLYTSAFVSGYEKTISELQKKDEDQ